MYASVDAKYSVQPNQPPDVLVVTVLSRAEMAAEISRVFDRMRELTAQAHVPAFLSLDVTMQQAKALHLVQCSPGIRMSTLAGRLGVGLSTVSGNVDRLAEMGLVARHGEPSDRRQVVITLTDQGHEVVERFQDLGAQLMRDLLESLGQDELLGLQRGVTGLVRALEQRLGGIPGEPEARSPGASVLMEPVAGPP